jgi:hypothetical protein
MPLTPTEPDAVAGYTETLIAVAVRYPEHGPHGQVPWAHIGSAGIDVPGDLWTWLRNLPDWESGNVNYVVYIVPEADYRPIYELDVPAVMELDTFQFLATVEEMDAVRSAIAAAGE